MNKKVIFLILCMCILAILGYGGLQYNAQSKRKIGIENKQYEQYLDKEIYGTEVVSLINQAINHNETYHIEKNEKGMYIEDHQNSVLIHVVLITDEDKRTTTTFTMETIEKVGITEFIKNFNTTQFICTQKKYHPKTGKIAYIELQQKTV